MRILVLLSLLTSANAIAAGGPAPTTWAEFFPTLVWPLFNVVLLGSALFWKLKGPIKGFFKDKSEGIAEIMERANVKAKEAEMMMQMQRQKLEGMETEISKIHSEVDSEINSFKNTYVKDVEERVEKLKADAALKIEAEKNQLTNQLNAMLLDEVIEKAKVTIKTNKDLNQQATSKVLEGLR